MNKNSFLGIIFISIGIIWLLTNVGFIDGGFWENFWPLFLLIPALFFHFAFFKNRKNSGLLVPGGILLGLSVIFFYHIFFGWENSDITWPFYLFAVAFGLFEMYLFGNREKGLLVPITILTGIGLFFLLEMTISFDFTKVWPVVLIIVGVSLLVGRRSK